jgi:hypothetical protein
VNSNTGVNVLYVGGNYNANGNFGMFYFNANNDASNTNGNLGSRHLVYIHNAIHRFIHNFIAQVIPQHMLKILPTGRGLVGRGQASSLAPFRTTPR